MAISLVANAWYPTPEDKQYAVDQELKNWYVDCSITGEKIPLHLLRYWDVDKQEAYKDYTVVPGNVNYNPSPELIETYNKFRIDFEERMKEKGIEITPRSESSPFRID